MMAQARPFDHVHWYMNEVMSRVVAKSGIPSDRYHFGKIVLQSFKDDLDFVAQIDGGTGDSETNGSLLKRSIQCAIGFREMGLKQGDVMVLMAPNHLDIAVPFYAAMYLGVVIAPIERSLKVGELEHIFKYYKPSIVICHSEKTLGVQTALETLNINSRIVTFDRHNHGPCLADLLKAEDEEVGNFKAEDFNTEESIVTILCTSGTTGGLPKGAAFTYKTLTITGTDQWIRFIKFPTPTRSRLILSPLQWLSATLHFIMAPIMKFTRIQSSKTATLDHIRYLINTYKPTAASLNPSTLVRLLKLGDIEPCDLSCFDAITLSGSPTDQNTMKLVKAHLPNTVLINTYGLTELSSAAFQVQEDSPFGSCGKSSGIYENRIINVDTQEDIKEPYVNGELLIRGPMFEGYYNNPKETNEAFAENGWFKTGDLFYRDEQWNFFFVERIKFLVNYDPAQMISPTEIEGVIRTHPNVIDVAVTGIPDPECIELPAACVIPKPGCSLTAQEIKDLVKEKLSDGKQLRGGVAFVTNLPMTASGKIHRNKLKDMIRDMKLE